MSNLVLIVICVLAVLLAVPFILAIFSTLGGRHKKKHRG